MKHLFILILIVLATLFAKAQEKITKELETLLKDKTNFYDIKETVYQYYNGQLQKMSPSDSVSRRLVNRQLKFWNRKFYDAEFHLAPDGKIGNGSKYILEANNKLESNGLASPSASSSNWTLIGPTYVFDGIGRVNRLAFHPTNASIIYAGTPRSGLWRSVNGGASWQPISSLLPSLGISGIVIDHSNPNNIYVLTGDGDASLSSRGFVISFNYMSYSQGVFKSTDAGVSWTKTADLFPGIDTTQYEGFQLKQDPNNANVLIAATSAGIFRTSNGGQSWTKSSLFMKYLLNLDDPITNFIATDIEFKPGSSSTVYITGRNDDDRAVPSGTYLFLHSTDGGINFNHDTVITRGFELGLSRMEIAVTPAAPNNVYLLCGPGFILDGNAAGSDDTFKGFLKSNNNGNTFTKLATSPDILAYNPTFGITLGNQGIYDLALAVSPTNSNTIFTGGLVVYRSTDGGVSFSGNTAYWESEIGEKIHPDVHDLKYNPLDGKIYAATDGGVSVSSDNGGSWTKLFNGLSISAFYHMEPDNENNKLWGGTQDDGILEQSGGGNFINFAGGDGFDVMTDNIVGNGNDSYWTTNGSLTTTRITGNSDITPPAGTGISRNFGYLDMDPTNEDHIYVGYSDGLWYSNDQGASWTTSGSSNIIGSANSTSANWCIQTCPSNASRVYYAGSGSQTANTSLGIWRADNVDFNAQSTGTVVYIGRALAAAGFPLGVFGTSVARISDILVSPTNSNQVWVTASGYFENAKVFASTDGGVSWTNISGSLPNVPANCLLMDTDGTIYLGTDIGVFIRDPGGNDWVPYFNGLPRVPITEMHFSTEFIPPATFTRYIYASTFGRSIWKSEPYSGCAPTMNITQTLSGQNHYQASSTITSTSQVNGTAGTNIYFQAGNSITLTPNFEALSGVIFQSLIRNCNSGPIPGMPEYLQKFYSTSIDTTPIAALIENVSYVNGIGNISLNIRDSGTYSIQILSPTGDSSTNVFTPTRFEKGKYEMKFKLPRMKPGFYIMTLFKNQDPIHFQELELR